MDPKLLGHSSGRTGRMNWNGIFLANNLYGLSRSCITRWCCGVVGQKGIAPDFTFSWFRQKLIYGSTWLIWLDFSANNFNRSCITRWCGGTKEKCTTQIFLFHLLNLHFCETSQTNKLQFYNANYFHFFMFTFTFSFVKPAKQTNCSFITPTTFTFSRLLSLSVLWNQPNKQTVVL